MERTGDVRIAHGRSESQPAPKHQASPVPAPKPFKYAQASEAATSV